MTTSDYIFSGVLFLFSLVIFTLTFRSAVNGCVWEIAPTLTPICWRWENPMKFWIWVTLYFVFSVFLLLLALLPWEKVYPSLSWVTNFLSFLYSHHPPAKESN